MNYQEIIQPIDFSALFQLVFTLYAAFIAVEYAKSFTARVIRRFYDFHGEIKTQIAETKKLCRDEEMLNIESDDYYNTGEGLCLVEDYNRKFKECEEKATEIENDLKSYIERNTEYRIFRHFSIFMMLFSFTLMMSGGVYRVYPSQTTHFLLAFILLAVIFVLIGWACAIFRAIQTWTEKLSFIVVGFFYIISMFLSFVAIRIQLPWSVGTKELLWVIGILIAVLMPYLNFLFFFILVTIQMNKIRKYCKQCYSPLIQLCNEAGILMGKMLNHQEMKNKVDEHKKQRQQEVENNNDSIKNSTIK